MTLRDKFCAEFPLGELIKAKNVELIGKEPKQKAKCPFHEDSSPSFTYNSEKGSWKCHAGCGAGGSVEFIALRDGKTKESILDAYKEALDEREGKTKQKAVALVPAVDWPACVAQFGEAHCKRLCEWRGYRPEFVAELVNRQMVGMCEGNLAFPIHVAGKVSGTHQKIADGAWITRGNQHAWVIGEHFENVFIFESQWDAFALMDAVRWFEVNMDATCAIVITRGAQNGKLVQNLFPLKGKVYVWMQNDKTDEKGNNPAQKWLSDIVGIIGSVNLCKPPDEVKDLNDWCRAGATTDQIVGVMETAPRYRDPKRPPIKRPLDIRKAMDFDPSADPDCLIGRRYLCRGGSAIWVGGSGIGKSVMTIQAAIQFALGVDLFGLEPKRHIRSGIMTCEDDYGDICETIKGVLTGMGIDRNDPRFATVEENVLVFNEEDTRDQEFIDQCQETVQEYKLDCLWINPLLSYYTSNPSDPEKSAAFTGRLSKMQAITKVCTMLVHHTGKPKDSKSTADWSMDDYSYVGLGSSVWTNWARAILVLQGLKSPVGTYVLRFAKRGQRAGIVDEDFKRVREIYLKHAQVGLSWVPSDYKPGEKDEGGRPEKANWELIDERWDGTPISSKQLTKLCQEVLSVGDRTSFRVMSKWSGINIVKNTNDLWVKIAHNGSH